jgi:DNA repair exonuclease SbcCD ATPase subunit
MADALLSLLSVFQTVADEVERTSEEHKDDMMRLERLIQTYEGCDDSKVPQEAWAELEELKSKASAQKSTEEFCGELRTRLENAKPSLDKLTNAEEQVIVDWAEKRFGLSQTFKIYK